MLDQAHPHRTAHVALGQAIGRRAPASTLMDHDDIHQVASLRLALRLRAQPDLTPTPSYLRRVANNALVDAMRKRGSQRLRDQHATAIAHTMPRTPEDLLMGRELASILSEHFSRLPAARREAVTRYVQGERVPEIALAIGAKPKRVENLVYRGLRSLRRSLTQAGLSPGAPTRNEG